MPQASSALFVVQKTARGPSVFCWKALAEGILVKYAAVHQVSQSLIMEIRI